MAQAANVNESFFDRVKGTYSDTLSIELAELQRDIYLPLLPMERLTHSVMVAYEDEGLPYWFKDEVYTSVLGNFYIPMMFPMVENTDESTDMVHSAPENAKLKETGGYKTEEYTTRTYVELVIPKYIVMNFTDMIPKGTTFIVGFIGGSNSIDSIKILSVAWLPDEEVDTNYAHMGPNEPGEGRGKEGQKSEPIENKKATKATRTTGGSSNGTSPATVKTNTTNSAKGRTSTTSKSSTTSRAVSGTRYGAPSPFSTMVDLSGLNMATVRKKVHEDLQMIKEETIRRQQLNARREIING